MRALANDASKTALVALRGVEALSAACYEEDVADDDSSGAMRPRPSRAGTHEAADSLPVVARMVVEIRSDGRRVVARGALEDGTSGERIAVELSPTSPWAMAKALAKMLVTAPWKRGASLRRRLRGED